MIRFCFLTLRRVVIKKESSEITTLQPKKTESSKPHPPASGYDSSWGVSRSKMIRVIAYIIQTVLLYWQKILL
jgi:hypothetical protein